ncbi:MAG: D-TA family PLP-dependent enzyme [Verrucomicrobia bacterium]|nr:D-TA family PLP-dependent enzyme [Verrucomicrobiota bacterium]
MNTATYTFPNVDKVPSPALLIYPDRIRNNIRRMVEIAGDPDRLRPHVKTHKLAEIVRMQMEQGIHKFKCATLAEAEMLRKEKADDILLAIQPVGPDIAHYVQLAAQYPESDFSVVVDNGKVIEQLDQACCEQSVKLGVFLDINTGMDRTGVIPGDAAVELYQLLHDKPNFVVKGLQAYDGHLHISSVEERTQRCDEAFAKVIQLVERLKALGLSVPVIVAGGSPSFPVHAKRAGVELSPGTTLLWDFKSLDSLKDLPFDCAAFLLTRVISKPSPGLVCFDLGHKAVASEMPHPRVRLLGLEDAEFVGHSEEHLVAKVDNWGEIVVGDTYLGIPSHVCPTVALYDHVNVIEKNKVVGTWKNAARHRL